ncbi:MAG TPA: Fe-S protein assembly co-chaperone HscB [Acidiferrobacterales bacterium]|nr:Fe-S protein assembly co-chaperone HscB [Acidiferrobacterales bacterium]
MTELRKDYFALFGLPVTFDLNSADLAARYRELQRSVHPDKFSHTSAQERRLSVQMTAYVNEAFQTLKDPLKRGRYLLHLEGVETDEETDTVMDPAFLADQMKLRERLEEIRSCRSQALLSEFTEDVKQRLRAKIDALRLNLAQTSYAARDRARGVIREMQFLEKLLQETERLEEEY